MLNTTLSGSYKIEDRYKKYVYYTISIQNLAGKVQNCLAYGADPKKVRFGCINLALDIRHNK